MKLAAEWGPHDLKRALEERRNQILVLDVRHRQGFREGHIPGAKNIPLEELDSRLKELPRDAEIVTYCWNITCTLCTKAAAFLSSKGFRARELAGGIAQWQASGFATER
jgi:ArsR family transcriptional regulator